MKQTGPVTLTIDMKDHVARSREVLEELQMRHKQFAPGAKEDYVLRSLLLEITFDYLEAKKKSNPAK
ncbi:MAG: hypothetical protein ACJ8LD_20065 [Pantoea agglomerans]